MKTKVNMLKPVKAWGLYIGSKPSLNNETFPYTLSIYKFKVDAESVAEFSPYQSEVIQVVITPLKKK